MDSYLEGRIAIITGGFNGIGKAIAIALAERGATIAVGARREPSAAVIEELDAAAEQLFDRRLDVADLDGLRAAIDDTAARHGRLDAVFANDGTEDQICLNDGDGTFTCADASGATDAPAAAGLGRTPPDTEAR